MMPVGIHLQEDLLFNVKVLCFAESIYVTDKCFYHYNNYNVESVTKRYYQNKFEMLNYVHNYVVEYFELRTKTMIYLQEPITCILKMYMRDF